MVFLQSNVRYGHTSPQATFFFFFFFVTLGLEMSDTKVYEPEIRALLGPASHYCEAPSTGASKGGPLDPNRQRKNGIKGCRKG
jgi:hypothetical protein